jgi:hypothetical protein
MLNRPMLKRIHARNLVILAAACLALSACVVVPTRRGLYVGPAVAAAPPAPQVEYYGAAPYPGYFWVGGYWNWTGYRYTWMGGHWQAPRRGYTWVPRRWVHGRDGWHMRGGRWARR